MVAAKELFFILLTKSSVVSYTFSKEVIMPPSLSENNSLSVLTDEDLRVYSIGISTGGVAEMRMASLHPQRHVIATTIDLGGAKFAKKYIDEKGLSKQVDIKIEDVTQPLPYDDDFFDFIYARLVLHYLTRDQLTQALKELHRIMKNGGKLFVVVRSTQCDEASGKNAKHDPQTGLTTYTTSTKSSYSRYFHTENSICEYLLKTGFSIKHVNSYKEQLYVDFQRTKPASQVDTLIEVVSYK